MLKHAVMIFIGNDLFGAKWKNYKILFKEIDEDSYAAQEMAYPTIYNLLVDPKEEVPELNYLNDTWVDVPLYRVVEEFDFYTLEITEMDRMPYIDDPRYSEDSELILDQ